MWSFAGVVFTFVYLSTSTSDKITDVSDLHKILKLCHPGDISENEHNKCICTPNYIYECSPKPDVADKNDTDLISKPTCYPEMIYMYNSTTCICSKDGFWPHPKCENIFKSFPNNSTGRIQCEPNSYVKVDCNVCKCGPDGMLDKQHCTTNKCNNTEPRAARRLIEGKHVFGSCEDKNWYSFAPCQLCYCISENKLVCNTGNTYSKKLQLGSYNLSVCGESTIKDAISLIPEEHIQNILRNNPKEERTEISSTTTQNVIKIDDSEQVSYEINNEQKEISEESRAIKDETAEINEDVIETNNDVRQNLKQSTEESDDENIKNASPVQNDTVELYSQSNELDQKETSVNPLHTEELKSTKYPNDNADEMLADANAQSDETDEGLEVQETPNPDLFFSNHQEMSKKNINLVNIGDALKPYLPEMLGKIFQMALRKSLVSIDHKANCTPGTTTIVNCNSCFCMKNYKLLCTNYNCT